MADLDSTKVYGDLTVNNDIDVKGVIKENGKPLSEKLAKLEISIGTTQPTTDIWFKVIG